MSQDNRTDQGKVAGSTPTPPPAPGVQGEGDYEAAPDSAEEGRELLEAERRGRDRARGEDRHDVMQEAAIDSPQDDKAI